MRTSKQRLRIVVLGDCAVGKTKISHQILNGAGQQPQNIVLGTSFGATMEICILPSGTVLEIVEIGGNRGFSPDARHPLLGRTDGIIFVARRGHRTSLASLYWWYQEAKASVDRQRIPFAVVQTVQGNTEGAAPTQATTSIHRVGLQLWRSIDLLCRPIAPHLAIIWEVARNLSLLLLSFILFGPTQSVVPARHVTAATAVSTLVGDTHCELQCEIDIVKPHPSEELLDFLEAVQRAAANKT